MVGKVLTPAQRAEAQARFVALLARGELSVVDAAAAAGMALPTLQTWRQHDAEFAAAWRRAMQAGRGARLHDVLATRFTGSLHEGHLARDCPEARQQVLDLLSEGYKEPHAARRLGLAPKTVWRWRRDPGFDAQWHAAHRAGRLAVLEMNKRRFARLRHERRQL